MRKCISCLLFTFLFYAGYSQDVPLTSEEKAMLDSMFRNDEFLKMLGERFDTSYAEVGLGISNGIFSLKDNSQNAVQATTDKLFGTVSASYFHKSGLGISTNAFITSDDGKIKCFQYGISPSYNYSSKEVKWGISYTRFIKGTTATFDGNPYKNDLYATLTLKKYWLQPSMGMGYSSGRTKEYFDSVITFIQSPSTVTIRDTITTKLSSFSLHLSVSHSWEFEDIFVHDDVVQLQPSLIINGSNLQLDIVHSRKLNSRRPAVQKLLKRSFGNGKEKDRFSLQSAAFLAAATYGKGRLLIQPQLYLDYYLQDSTSKKLSGIYSVMISFAF